MADCSQTWALPQVPAHTSRVPTPSCSQPRVADRQQVRPVGPRHPSQRIPICPLQSLPPGYREEQRFAAYPAAWTACLPGPKLGLSLELLIPSFLASLQFCVYTRPWHNQQLMALLPFWQKVFPKQLTFGWPWLQRGGC